MRYEWLLIATLLTGCASKEPTELVIETAKQEVVEVQKTIERLEKTTPEVCKTDAFNANLEAVKAQVSAISGQLENATKTCALEKDVLKEQIEKWRGYTFGLGFFALAFLFLLFKRR